MFAIMHFLETHLFLSLFLLHSVLASNSEVLLQAGKEEVQYSMCVKCNIEECVLLKFLI